MRTKFVGKKNILTKEQIERAEMLQKQVKQERFNDQIELQKQMNKNVERVERANNYVQNERLQKSSIKFTDDIKIIGDIEEKKSLSDYLNIKTDNIDKDILDDYLMHNG